MLSLPFARRSQTIKSLGGDDASDEAKTVMGWLEKGVFDALGKGYLEKALLVMSADEAGEHVLEAWSLSVVWRADEHGVSHPTLQMGAQNGRERSVAVKNNPGKYTQQYARETSQAMLRQLQVRARADQHATRPRSL